MQGLRSHHRRKHNTPLDEGLVLGLREVWNAFAEEKKKANAHYDEVPVVLRGERVERVSAFPYLGSILGEDSVGKELSARLRKAGEVFNVMKPHV